MFKWLEELIHGKDIKDALYESKRVKVNGVLFTIKKVDPYSYMSGANSLLKNFATYEDKRQSEKPSAGDIDFKAIKEHHKDVFLTCVLKPELSKDGKGETIDVNDILSQPELSANLYKVIVEYSYGKKKVAQSMSLGLT